MKAIAIFSAIFLVFFVGCVLPNEPIACTADAKLCPDGSGVGRVGPNCEFAPCPETNSTQTACESSECGPQLGMPNYLCPDGKTTAGPTGRCLRNSDGTCGWEVTSCPAPNQNEPLKQNYCTAGQRQGEMCIELSQPVCGWFDPARVQCIRYPCANTFSNSCFACHDDKILYWTEGECPK